MSVWDRITHYGCMARDTTRKFTDWGIEQETAIPNALDPRAFNYDRSHPGMHQLARGRILGGWTAGDDLMDGPPCSEREAVAHAMRWGVNEAVHEMLEWLQLDGQPVLYPHDPYVEDAIFKLCDDLADDLIALANASRRSKEQAKLLQRGGSK